MILDRINTGNTLLFLSIVAMANIPLYFGVGQNQFLNFLGIQGLIISFLGASILALPDVPSLRSRTTPTDLQKAWTKLIETNNLYRDDHGFSDLISLIDRNTSRVGKKKFERLQIRTIGDYGSVPVKASESRDEIPRFQLTETIYLEQWISNEADRKYRLAGLVLLGSGFIFQLGSQLNLGL